MGAPSFLTRIVAFKFFDGFLLVYPLYGVMFVDGGLSPLEVSITLVAWSTTAFLLQIPSGVLADRWPRRWLLCAAQLARGLGFLAWLLIPGFFGFLLGLVLWGVKSAFTNGVFEALVYDELRAAGREEDYARVIGRAHGVGFAAILLASVAAAGVVGFGYPAILVGSLAAAGAAAWAAAALPQARASLAIARRDFFGQLRGGFAYAARHPRIPAILAVLAVTQTFALGLDGFWPIFGAEVGLSPQQTPLLVAAIGAAQALGAWLAHRVRGWGDAAVKALLPLTGLLLASAAGLFQPWTVALIVLACGLNKVADVNFDSRLHQAIPSEMRATLASAKSFTGQALMTLMLMGFGPLAQATSYRAAFLASGGAMALAGAAFLVLRPRT